MASTANATIADGSVMRLFLFPDTNFDALPGDVFGSVVASSPEATTVALGCNEESAKSDVFDFPQCEVFAGVTVTNGPSTFHGASGCAEATKAFCIEVDCKITGTTEATCVETTAGQLKYIFTDTSSTSLSPDELVTYMIDTEFDAIETTTITREIASESMPYFEITMAPLVAPYDPDNDDLPLITPTGNFTGVTSWSSAETVSSETASKDGTSSTASTGAPAPAITGDSSASQLLLGLSGGLAGAAAVGMALL